MRGAGVQALGTTAFPDALAGGWMESEATRTEFCTFLAMPAPQLAALCLAPATKVAPRISIFSMFSSSRKLKNKKDRWRHARLKESCLGLVAGKQMLWLQVIIGIPQERSELMADFPMKSE